MKKLVPLVISSALSLGISSCGNIFPSIPITFEKCVESEIKQEKNYFEKMKQANPDSSYNKTNDKKTYLPSIKIYSTYF